MNSSNLNIFAIISVFLICWCKGVYGNYNAANYKTDRVEKEYDYVVVGGGTSGCVVSSRLSENGKLSVLLIEAGGIPDPNLSIPALTSPSLNILTNMKQYHSVPQRNAGLINGGVISYRVGRTLGGSSSVNGMIFSRGSEYDYDSWANLTGDPSWRYRNLLKYFKKMESYKGGYPLTNQHGTAGPITISRPNFAPGLTEWLEAGRHLGYPNADPSGPQRISFGAVEFTKKFGRRVSSFSAYIKPFMESRSNLKVITNSEVKRIIFKGNCATGVTFSKQDGNSKNNYFVQAKREIILSAGVMGSSEILFKSGIGPKKMLESVGIPSVKNLPVGMNLQDHPMLSLHFILNNRSAVFIPERDLNLESWLFYNQFGDGPYSNHLSASLAFIASSVASASAGGNVKDWSDIELMYEQDTRIYLDTEQPELLRAASNEAIVSAFVYLTRPKSRGSVSLNVTTGNLSIDFQFFSHPDDMQAIIDGIQTTLKVLEESPSFQRLGARYSSEPIPACKHILPFRSPEYWRCFVRQRVTSGLHGAGTCKMGQGAWDPTAVVDSQLKVIGVKNLRIADNSVMPRITNSNTEAAAYLIGEKAADMILLG